ncbi:MAG: Nascent polypeptide-associated complex subunit beta [Watsoniomyces obsoletus]|nr:MAG: Nascent polypeptide-associated complex subunit beta [Watsoniomyces obsoletus]
MSPSKTVTPIRNKLPVYFLSHGGPNLIFDTTHPARAVLEAIGKEITTSGKAGGMKAVVIFSAHWEASSPGTVEINVAERTELINDFYGFPRKYYQQSYPNLGSPSIAKKVSNVIEQAGFKVKAVQRGLDHGIWIPFKCAFPDSNPLSVPIIQVSLLSTSNPAEHYALGQALSSLRREGIQIIGSGMAVHNLRDFMLSMGDPDAIPGYCGSFDIALKDAVTAWPVEKRKEVLMGLMKRGDARRAHPSWEHLLPLFVAAGAAGGGEGMEGVGKKEMVGLSGKETNGQNGHDGVNGEDGLEEEPDKGERLWTYLEGSLSWAQFRFGKPVVESS